MSIRRVVILGLFVAIAGVLHSVESWVPLLFLVPGIKLGLANVVALITIALYGWRDALLVSVLRVFLGTLLVGVLLGPSFVMSFSGAVVSTLVMSASYYFGRRQFSLLGISVIGAVAHNVTQISVAALVVASSNVFWYLPYLILLAVPTGIATGLTAVYFLTKLPQDVIL
ncbi:MAG: Heptaprenyl diphosphate synthase component [Firmicutes bacterium]|nr:Heptaprenyl diphosphate synthase component [Bacillota bacterium]